MDISTQQLAAARLRASCATQLWRLQYAVARMTYACQLDVRCRAVVSDTESSHMRGACASVDTVYAGSLSDSSDSLARRIARRLPRMRCAVARMHAYAYGKFMCVSCQATVSDTGMSGVGARARARARWSADRDKTASSPVTRAMHGVCMRMRHMRCVCMQLELV